MEQYYGYIICLVIGFFVAMLFCRSSLKKEYNKKLENEIKPYKEQVKNLRVRLNRLKNPKYQGTDDILDEFVEDLED